MLKKKKTCYAKNVICFLPIFVLQSLLCTVAAVTPFVRLLLLKRSISAAIFSSDIMEILQTPH